MSEKDYLDYVDAIEWQKRWLQLKQNILLARDWLDQRCYHMNITDRIRMTEDVLGGILENMEDIENGKDGS